MNLKSICHEGLPGNLVAMSELLQEGCPLVASNGDPPLQVIFKRLAQNSSYLHLIALHWPLDNCHDFVHLEFTQCFAASNPKRGGHGSHLDYFHVPPPKLQEGFLGDLADRFLIEVREYL